MGTPMTRFALTETQKRRVEYWSGMFSARSPVVMSPAAYAAFVEWAANNKLPFHLRIGFWYRAGPLTRLYEGVYRRIRGERVVYQCSCRACGGESDTALCMCPNRGWSNAGIPVARGKLREEIMMSLARWGRTS